jgi:hypothetical protein
MEWYNAYYTVTVTNVVGVKQAVIEGEELFDTSGDDYAKSPLAESVTSHDEERSYTITFNIHFSSGDFQEASADAQSFIAHTEKYGAELKELSSIERD